MQGHVTSCTQKGLLWAAGAWVTAQLHWLAWAYHLEFKGHNYYMHVWAASLLFLASNTSLMWQLMQAVHRSICLTSTHVKVA